MVLEGRGAAAEEEEEEEAAEARGRAACSLTAALLVALAGESGADTEAHARALCRALLDAASGGLPSGCVTPVAEAMHAGWVAAGDARLGGWLRFALDMPPAFPRAGLEAFLVALLSEANRRDVRRFKRVLKAFCGGKRKGGGHP